MKARPPLDVEPPPSSDLTERMADFWPLFSDDVVTDDDDDGRANVRTSTIATDGAFGDNGGAVGSFDDELVRARARIFTLISFKRFFGLARADAKGAIGFVEGARGAFGGGGGVLSSRTDRGE